MNVMEKELMGSGAKSVNVVGVGVVNLHEAHFEAIYNEEINFLANKGGEYQQNYPWPGVNPG